MFSYHYRREKKQIILYNLKFASSFVNTISNQDDLLADIVSDIPDVYQVYNSVDDNRRKEWVIVFVLGMARHE